MKKEKNRSILKPCLRFVKTPFAIALSILLVGIGLFFGMYAVIQDNFFRIITEHEMEVMRTLEDLGSKTVDAKLAELKGYCLDNLIPLELGLIPTDPEQREAVLHQVHLPEDGLNLAYWSEGTLICQKDSFRADLEGLDLASVEARKEAVVFDPYFDEAGNYILTVAAATRESSGVFVVQYDGYCISRWLHDMMSPMEFGTAYIVDTQGYNIAAAREENMDWVTTRYNAQHYARQDPNTQNVSVAKLEGLALAGEQGIGTYEWEGSTSHVAYGPLTEAPWGYYAGFYESELRTYTKNIASISGRSAALLLTAFGTFVGMIVALLFRSLTREHQYNQELLVQRMAEENRSRQDPLTGVKNKRAWQEAREQLDGEIQAGTAQFAIGVCDVNGLKQVNDTLGHEAGDNLIFRASRYICKVFAHSPVYRIGGDEFTVILQGEDLQNWEALAASFDAGMAEQDGEAPVSIALGIAHYHSEDSASLDVFYRADKGMYQKKTAMKAK